MLWESLNVAAIVSLVVFIFLGLVITLGDAFLDSSFKEIVTGKVFVTWVRRLWRGFVWKLFAFIWLVGTLLFWIPGYDACEKSRKEKIGACTCRCKACQETAKKVDAAIQYLSLDEEDIEDLILQKKAEEVEVKEVAIPTVK